MPAIIRAGNHFTVPTASNVAPPQPPIDWSAIPGIRARKKIKKQSFIGPRAIYKIQTIFFAPVKMGPVETEAERIIAAIGRVFLVPRCAIISVRRLKPLIPARFATYMLLRDLTSKSLPEIGRMIGNRDHTTVMHGIDKAEYWMQRDAEFKTLVERVLAELHP